MFVVRNEKDPRAAVGRHECFEGQFRESNVDRCTEHRGGTEEAQNRAVNLQLHRYGDRCRRVVTDVGGAVRSGQGTQFLLKRDEMRVGAGIDLAAQAIEQMRPPFGKIPNARRKALRMEAQAQDIHRGLQ